MTGSNTLVPDISCKRVQFSLRKVFIAVSVIAIFMAGAAWFVRSLHYGFFVAPLDAYATMYGAGTVRTYLHRNNDQWPESWEDLRLIYDERYKLGDDALTFDEMKERLEINFDVNPEELRRYEFTGDEPPFRVIRLRNGREVYWAGAEPNTLILRYLKKQESKPKD